MVSRSMVAMLVGALGIACAGSGVSASYAMAHREALPVAAPALRSGARPWWSAFGSETLNTLIADAGHGAAASSDGSRQGAPGDPTLLAKPAAPEAKAEASVSAGAGTETK